MYGICGQRSLSLSDSQQLGEGAIIGGCVADMMSVVQLFTLHSQFSPHMAIWALPSVGNWGMPKARGSDRHRHHQSILQIIEIASLDWKVIV